MRIITLITALGSAVSPAALAQNGAGGNGDSPQNRGSTGWTGVHPDTGGATMGKAKPGESKNATTGQSVQVHDQDEAKDQPLMATGEDLKGPPQRFAPSQTPE